MIELLLSLLGLFCGVGVSLYAIREMKATRSAIPSLSDYIKKGEEGEIIMREDLAMIIDGFGSRIAKSLKMSFLQGLGAQAKLDKGLKGAFIESAVANQMPLIKLAGEIFGIPVEKYLKKHPDAMLQLAPMAQSFMGGKGGFDLNSLMGQGQPSRHGHDGVGYGRTT